MKRAATRAIRRQVVPPIAIPAVWDLLRGGGLPAPDAASDVVAAAGGALETLMPLWSVVGVPGNSSSFVVGTAVGSEEPSVVAL
jgi:hypothetical protein